VRIGVRLSRNFQDMVPQKRAFFIGAAKPFPQPMSGWPRMGETRRDVASEDGLRERLERPAKAVALWDHASVT